MNPQKQLRKLNTQSANVWIQLNNIQIEQYMCNLHSKTILWRTHSTCKFAGLLPVACSKENWNQINVISLTLMTRLYNMQIQIYN